MIQLVKQNPYTGTKGTPFSPKTKAHILEKNRKNFGLYTCEHCGFSHDQKTYVRKSDGPPHQRSIGDGCFHVDHYPKPFSKGGRGVPSNGRVLCGTCNTSQGNRLTVGLTGARKWIGLHAKKLVHELTKKTYLRKSVAFKKHRQQELRTLGKFVKRGLIQMKR